MFKALFKVLFKVIKLILDIFLLPINGLIVNAFPNFGIAIQRFTAAVGQYIGNTIGYFAYMIPPMTKHMIILYVTVLISYYTITISVHVILKVIQLIKAIKIW